jgi:hypothetical protein
MHVSDASMRHRPLPNCTAASSPQLAATLDLPHCAAALELLNFQCMLQCSLLVVTCIMYLCSCIH